jgi:hypothetical protein
MMPVRGPATHRLPLCRPSGWAALWRRLAKGAALNT